MDEMKNGLIIGSVFCLFSLVWFIIDNTDSLTVYPLYVSILMMIGLYAVGVLVFAGMYSVGSYLFND